MVRTVLDALSAPQGAGDLRTRPPRYHDALGEAMRRLLASNPLPKRARHSVKALAHIHFAELIAMDKDSPIRKIGFPVVGQEPLPAGEQHGLPALAG
jgi:hypothetical protein